MRSNLIPARSTSLTSTMDDTMDNIIERTRLNDQKLSSANLSYEKNLTIGNMKLFSSGLMSNTTIKTLYICGIDFDTNVVKIFSDALKVNSTIQSLALCENCFGLYPEEMEHLADALKVNTTIRELDLSENGFGECQDCPSVGFLSEIIKHNTSIRTLRLCNNKLGKHSENMGVIMDSLKVNTTIKKLTLNQNLFMMHNLNFEFLSEFIKHNKTIRNLECNYNMYGEYFNELELLFGALKVNTSIKTLRLCGNSFGKNPTESIKFISEYLKNNRKLQVLFLDDNCFRDTHGTCVIWPILVALKFNDTIKEIYIAFGNHIDRKSLNFLHANLKRNRRNHFLKSLSLFGLLLSVPDLLYAQE